MIEERRKRGKEKRYDKQMEGTEKEEGGENENEKEQRLERERPR